MKVTAKLDKSYTITIGGKQESGWVEESSWEGMTKMRRNNETLIVAGMDTFESIFEALLTPADRQSVELSIVSGSPSVINRLKRGKAEEAGGADG